MLCIWLAVDVEITILIGTDAEDLTSESIDAENTGKINEIRASAIEPTDTNHATRQRCFNVRCNAVIVNIRTLPKRTIKQIVGVTYRIGDGCLIRVMHTVSHGVHERLRRGVDFLNRGNHQPFHPYFANCRRIPQTTVCYLLKGDLEGSANHTPTGARLLVLEHTLKRLRRDSERPPVVLIMRLAITAQVKSAVFKIYRPPTIRTAPRCIDALRHIAKCNVVDAGNTKNIAGAMDIIPEDDVR